MGLSQTSAPAVEPVTRTEAKLHVKATHDADDALIDDLIVAAREDCESYQQRQFITATWEWKRDAFPASTSAVLRPPRPPLQSVTSIKYVDTDGVEQTWDSGEYTTDGMTENIGRIALAYGYVWPTTRAVIDAVTVTYKAGYGDAATDVPLRVKQAMLLLIGHWYRFRGPVTLEGVPREIPLTVRRLLYPKRVMEVV